MLSDSSVFTGGGQQGFAQPDDTLFEKIGFHKKAVLAFILLILVVSIGLCSLGLLSAKPLVFFVQVAGFFALGCLHMTILRTNVAQLSHGQKIAYSLLLAAFLALVVIIVSYLFTNTVSLSASAFVCAFLWPFLFREAAQLFEQVTNVPVSLWQYSPGLSLEKSTTFLNSIPVRFRIHGGQLGEEDFVASFRAPVRMKLGLIFYHTVQDQNSKGGPAVRLVSPEDEPYGWLFSVSGFGGQRYLDPELSLFENDVKENAVITARRLKAEPLLPES